MTHDKPLGHYDAAYGQFASDLHAGIRAEAFGEDIGQNSWLTADEQDLFIGWLGLTPDSVLLDVACGSGGPVLRIARITGCSVYGIDMHAQGVAEAWSQAQRAGLDARARFEQGDASRRLPWPDATFDGLICIDAVNHLPNRPMVFAEWARVLRPGGRVVFTDPCVVTGPLTGEELGIRSSIGFFLFVPPGADEAMLRDAGFTGIEVADRTDNVARMAARRRAARAARAEELRKIEGDATFEGQQTFFEVASRVAAEGRLSRTAVRGVRG
jgi:SAM-dependent methyltransferase